MMSDWPCLSSLSLYGKRKPQNQVKSAYCHPRSSCLLLSWGLSPLQITTSHSWDGFSTCQLALSFWQHWTWPWAKGMSQILGDAFIDSYNERDWNEDVHQIHINDHFTSLPSRELSIPPLQNFFGVCCMLLILVRGGILPHEACKSMEK